MVTDPEKIYYPGDVVCVNDGNVIGDGTYEFSGKIFASVFGKLRYSDKKDSDGKNVVNIISPIANSFHLPQCGDIVLAKITYVSMRFAKCSVFVLEGEPLSYPFKGQIRREDVRATEKDKVEMFKCFRLGDIVAARIIFPADNAGMLLTTAENELGVIWALSEYSQPLIPLSWCEMQCPLTGVIEPRKVAKRLPLSQDGQR